MVVAACREQSAYSVFNDGCESIAGTFKAEDYDKQLRSGGAGGVMGRMMGM